MGADLIASSAVARDTINRLDKRLSQLPASDVPQWTLLEMLESDAESSRIGEAEISQPICTAIQILQVDILRAAGVKFSAIVGHSSGEIGAAYATGLLSAEDAICIAYYRGLHAHLAQGPEGQKGAMMAVGTSYDDAQDLCIAPEFEGRACVGSVNSPVSVTLSGDEDSIKRLEIIFEDEEKFTRILRVDKAYHSHHMIPCGEKYAESLSLLEIKIASGEGGGRWTSSVYGKHVESHLMGLENQYWVKNLLSPVLFKDAVEGAIAHHGSFDLIVEVGPHPALKGPVLETLEKSSNQPPPYTGLFQRGSSAITSIADAIGLIVAHLGKSCINIHAYEQFISGHRQSMLVKGLPTYAWDHTKEHWHESRYAKAVRMRPGPLHPLLGHVTADSSPQDMRWRHVLQPSKLPWLSGHELQGQMVFPAAGYVVMALEAGALLSQNAMATLIELSDLDISKALTFDNEDTRVELIFAMSDIVRSKDKIEASIKCSAADDKAGSKLELLASGRLSILLGEPCHDMLPGRSPPPTNLMKVRSIEFYSCLERLEYQYSGPFAALYDLERKLGAATGMISRTESSMLIHPAMLDAAFQSTLLVYSAPNDGRLSSLHVPRRIRCVRANPYLCAERTVQNAPLSFDAVQTNTGDSAVIAGDIEIYGKDRENALIQIEGLECVAFAQSTALDDKELFSTVSWDVAEPNLSLTTKIGYESSDLSNETLNILERMASFYLRNLEREVPQDHPSRSEGPYQQWFHFAADSIVRAREGRLPLWKEEWYDDTATHLDALMKPHEDVVDVKFVRAIGEYISDIATGLRSSVEISLRDDVLGTYYSKGIGLPSYLSFLARSVKQLTHRNPSMNILEVGAGTGACTKAVFEEIGDRFASYTFSDVTPGFADSARTWASSTHLEKMLFKTFDVGQPPNTQGMQDQTYDLIIASLVLHATPSLEQTLKNIRRILKPGGYLIALEVVPTDLVHYGVMFGAFTGWWLGAHEGRSLSPALTRNQWHDLLETCGFSGCLNSTPEDIDIITPVFVFASQALDDRVRFLQNPLASVDILPALDRSIQELVIVGSPAEASNFVTEIESYVAPYCGQRSSLSSLAEISTINITSATTILCFADIAGSIWEDPSVEHWDALKACLMNAGTLVWVTSGRRRENPHTSITIGLVRSAVREISTLAYLFIDIYDGCSNPSQRVSEAFLRYNATRSFRAAGGLDTTIEAELVLNEDENWLIPRLIACEDMNNRYNCQARPIMTSSRGAGITIGYSDSGMHIEQESLSTRDEESKGQIRTIYSLSHAVKIGDHDFLYLVMGQQRDSSEFKVALTTEHKSTINPWSGCSTNANYKSMEDTDFLTLVSYQIQASAILGELKEGETLLVHEPNADFAAILSQEAEGAGVKAVFTTESKTTTLHVGEWLIVHPQATHRSLLALLPKSVSAFVNMANTPGHEIMRFVRSRYHNRCKYYTPEALLLATASPPRVSDAGNILKLLEEAVLKAGTYSNMRESRQQPSLDVLTLQSLSEENSNLTPAKIIDWGSGADVQVRVKPADNHIAFSPDRTYWLVGLTGSLGLSLCEWMIHHGAKHIVFTSRKPCIDERWLGEMAALHANVHVHQWSVQNTSLLSKSILC
jgi:hybrid polyketide synthase/nonribosomal peptide synthetase ACE1